MTLPVDTTTASAAPIRDAATLIIVRHDDDRPRVLMGRRHTAHKFMPGKHVFPGGRVDAGDCRVAPMHDLDPRVAARLLKRMRGRPSPLRARGLAMAAVRETFEEVGLVLGAPMTMPLRSRSPAWRKFFATGHGPDLAALRLIARAITPPGRPRRFDARFFVADASAIANLDAPLATASAELLEVCWVSIAEARDLDLPWITGEVLRRLEMALASSPGLTPDMPATFQYMRGKAWHYEDL